MRKGLLLIILALSFVMWSFSEAFPQESSVKCTRIIEAFERGDSGIAFEMIDKRTGNCSSLGDGSPLMAAVRTGNLNAVRKLVETYGADVNMAVQGDGSPLIQAAANGYLNITEYLIDKGAVIDAVVKGDETALINASANGYLNVVRFLIEKGADVNKAVWAESMGKRELRSPLSMARKNGWKKLAEFLVEKGAVENR